LQERISEEFKQLIEQAQQDGQHTAFVQIVNDDQFKSTQSKYFSFRTRALNLVGRACGADSDHYLQLRRLAEGEEAANTKFFYACLGIAEAAQHDFDAGLLFDMKSLIAAELLGNFIQS